MKQKKVIKWLLYNTEIENLIMVEIELNEEYKKGSLPTYMVSVSVHDVPPNTMVNYSSIFTKEKCEETLVMTVFGIPFDFSDTESINAFFDKLSGFLEDWILVKEEVVENESSSS